MRHAETPELRESKAEIIQRLSACTGAAVVFGSPPLKKSGLVPSSWPVRVFAKRKCLGPQLSIDPHFCLGEFMALPDETALRLLAQRKIKTGALPPLAPENVLAGMGSGLPCSLCEHPIAAHECEFEYANGGREVPRFHFRCQGIWLLVLAQSAEPEPPGAAEEP